MGNGSRHTITKADLVEAVHEKVGFSKKESTDIVERIFETIKGTLERGERVKLSGFGKFEVRHKRARSGRNPKTEETLIIPERRVLSFKPSQVLKMAVAGELVDGEAGAAAHDEDRDDEREDDRDADDDVDDVDADDDDDEADDA